MKKRYNIGWGLTSICNMNCKFCYSKDTRKKAEDTNISAWKLFVDENYDYIDSINYGTGENTLIDEFFEFIDYVRSKYPNITQSITTNGHLYERVYKDKKLYEIYLRCIDEVDVSLDFAIAEKHNNFRGQPKAYDWALNTLRMLKEDKKKATIVFVGFEETMVSENIDGLFKIAKDNNALIRLNIYRPVSESKEINDSFKLSYKTMKNALMYISKNYQIVGLSDVLFGSIYTNQENLIENTGVDSIRILPDGTICPSTYLINEKYKGNYNIKDGRFLNCLKFEDFETPPIPKECEDCTIVEKCKGGVFDRRILWNNTLEKRDPYCPFENGDTIETEKINITKKGRISVHDGYLPTMFFEN